MPVEKSTFTVFLASYWHYTVGYDVLVVGCDYSLWSIYAQCERELVSCRAERRLHAAHGATVQNPGTQNPAHRPQDSRAGRGRYGRSAGKHTGHCPGVLVSTAEKTDVDSRIEFRKRTSSDCKFLSKSISDLIIVAFGKSNPIPVWIK